MVSRVLVVPPLCMFSDLRPETSSRFCNLDKDNLQSRIDNLDEDGVETVQPRNKRKKEENS
jgi:hypothetical protein